MKKISDPFSLNKKLILITGASSGIGKKCAVTCSEMGASVILMGRDPDRLRETQALMEKPDQHISISADLTSYDFVWEKVREVIKEKGRIDGLINCAGISTTLPLNALSIEKMEHYFRTNVVSAINLTRLVIKPAHFSENGGSIVFISSVMGVVGEIGKTLYCMTKGALISAVRSMSLELAQRKIRVNSISPGVVVTPMSQKSVYSQKDDRLKMIADLHPLGLGKPSDVANACVFLLSDSSRWITGTNLVVDGGYMAR